MRSDELDGTRWALEYLTLDGVSHMVSGRAIPEVAFLGGRLAGDDGVNRGTGPYRVDDGSFLGGPFAVTRMAYPPEARPEHRLFEYMEQVTEVARHGDFLHLRFDGGELVYRWEDEVEEPA